MTTDTIEILACDALDDDITKGLAKKTNFGDQGSSSEPHYIYLIKMQTTLGDPTQRYKPKSGTQFFAIRPNANYPNPSHENGKDWNWYLLSCPHQVPCPILDE
jgi:hypothetical protein